MASLRHAPDIKGLFPLFIGKTRDEDIAQNRQKKHDVRKHLDTTLS
jgi:hypothetical protein